MLQKNSQMHIHELDLRSGLLNRYPRCYIEIKKIALQETFLAGRFIFTSLLRRDVNLKIWPTSSPQGTLVYIPASRWVQLDTLDSFGNQMQTSFPPLLVLLAGCPCDQSQGPYSKAEAQGAKEGSIATSQEVGSS